MRLGGKLNNKLPKRAIHYLETSGVNYLADNMTDHQFNLLVQQSMQVDLCISSVTLWEILLNSNDKRKDYLIYWMQFNCADYLLKSPSEIVIDFINRKLPRKERLLFAKDPVTKLQMGTTWKNIHGRIDKTLPIDLDLIREHSESARELSKQYSHFMDEMVAAENSDDPFHKMMLVLKDTSANSSEYEQRRIKTSLVIAFFLLCIGIELDKSHIREFWRPLGIDSVDNPNELRPSERLEYLVETLPLLFFRGPILEMSNMMALQREYEGKTNRGAMFDSMHAVYCYFVDNFITSDTHFTLLKEHTNTQSYDGILSAENYVEVHEKAYQMISANERR